jgi:hypothetical protein
MIHDQHIELISVDCTHRAHILLVFSSLGNFLLRYLMKFDLGPLKLL